jgi:hypothetical protein
MKGICVEVIETDIRVRSGTNDNGPWEMRIQNGYLHNGKHSPTPFVLRLGKDPEGKPLPAYKPGMYEIDPSSLQVEKGRLSFGYDLVLVPVAPVVADIKAAKVG